MGILTDYMPASKLLKTVKVCDIVEFNRLTYSHFAFYIGEGICVHVQAPDGSFSPFSSSSSSGGGSSGCRLGTKVAERLVSIAKGSIVRINNFETVAGQLNVKKRLTSDAVRLALNNLPVDSDGKVILGHSVPVSYCVISANNCEGWATYWKYDHPKGWSMQAKNGVIKSTVGSVERLSEGILAGAERILDDDEESVGRKIFAGTSLLVYAPIKGAATAVTKTTDFFTGLTMKITNW